MPKFISDLFYEFCVDRVWKALDYIAPTLFSGGIYLMEGWVAAILLGIASFLILFYIRHGFNEIMGVKGKLIYNAFEIVDYPTENKPNHNHAYFKVIINNCSYRKMFFKLSDKSSFKIHDRTTPSGDDYFQQITKSVNFILPKQIFTIPLPVITIPTEPETLKGIFNIIFDYGEKENSLKHKAEFEITCDLIYTKENDAKILEIENWYISKADI
jgi:hypothetical protein